MAPAPAEQDEAKSFTEILRIERATMASRREAAAPGSSSTTPPLGLALSGGGIRSATFSLGVLQELHARGLLKAFDYLSTVSGGGYVGGWWSALLSRPGTTEIFPPLRTGTPEAESQRLRHLRLHSNYLIPVIGTFSWDTWRAITVIGRNLVLTWLVLLPFVLAGIVGSQLYFLATAPDLITSPGVLSADVLARWWDASLPVLLGLVTAVIALTFVWLRYQGAPRADGRPAMPGLGWWAALLMMSTLLVIYVRSDNNGTAVNASRDEIAIVICLVVAGLMLAWRELTNDGHVHDRDLHRNNIAVVQQLFVMALGVAAVLLVAGGLGHLLVGSTIAVSESWAARAGGAASVLASIAAAGFTAARKAGVGGTGSSWFTRVLMRVAPTLLIVVLAAGFATLSQWLIVLLHTQPLVFSSFVLVSFYGVTLAWVYASYETRWGAFYQRRTLSLTVTALVGAAAGIVASVADAAPLSGSMARYAPVALAILCLYTVARRLGGVLVGDDEPTLYHDRAGRWRLELIVLAIFIAGGAAGRAVAPLLDVVLPAAGVPAGRGGAVAVAISALLAAVTWRWGSGQRGKALYLDLYAAIIGAMWLLVARENWALTHAPVVDALAVISATATWVLAFGWATDPNSLALHAFYKARLVRAYMGASNDLRHQRNTLIDDSVSGDDVRLASLANTTHGAPYHLVNATLNLAGDQTLGSLQRRAAPFVFSRDFCGSPHPSCGFRPTDEYMGGGLTLGTTVAISGAAASPEMGSQTPTGAVSMLMTMFNVRLGFWVPMPSNPSWRSRQARFWAFYTLREFLARTSDQASYGFLSDGGHFDNTAVYSLIARGCRLIVAADCGADPKRVFEDYGTLIRRCRIDFGAEISVTIDDLREWPPDLLSRSAFVVGTVQYSSQYLRDIGDPSPTDTVGHIVLVKPSIVGAEPLDVRQYRALNPQFPQQPTTDQFFDEAQFESYRRLGQCCADAALNALSTPAPPRDAATLQAAVTAYTEMRAKRAVVKTLNEGIDAVDL